MANEELANILRNIAFLSELKDENPFKIRALENSARIIEEQYPVSELQKSGKLGSIPGFGKGSQTIALEYLEKGEVQELEKLKKEFPPTIFEILEVRGLGPKKVKSLFIQLEISSLTELEYACNENRLLDLKGFGEKTQANILKGIAEIKSNRGKVILPLAQQLADTLLEEFGEAHLGEVSIVGELRRALPVVQKIEFLSDANIEKFASFAHKHGWEKSSARAYQKKAEGGVPLEISFSQDFFHDLIQQTGPAEFARKFGNFSGDSEAAIFEKAGMPFLPPETRDLGKILGKRLIEEQDIRGVFHLHTKASDGANTLEEMVQAAIALKLEYLGVSDHSQSAVYANGLKADRIKAQRKEIQKLQEKYPEIQIFQGVESDILADGSLDYPDEILADLDFVIASVHSQMKMEPAAMTKRLCKAMENPHTTWMGHWTGRLLLGRAEYSFDHDAVLKTAEKMQKGIELNANPYRLDVDWSLLPELVRRKISVGIFPDAHSIGGLQDTKWGVLMARKAGLGTEQIVNTLPRKEMQSWLQKRK